MRYALTEQKREIHLLKELVKAMRSSNPNARALGTDVYYEKMICYGVKMKNEGTTEKMIRIKFIKKGIKGLNNASFKLI